MKRWGMEVGTLAGGVAHGISGLLDLLARKRAGQIFLVALLAVTVSACAGRKEGGVLQQGEMTLDLPLEPSSPMKQRAALPVQTTPPPLGSGSTTRRAGDALGSTGMPVKELGIPARSVGAQTPAYAQGVKYPVQRKATTKKAKKSKASKKKKVTTATKRAAACPCNPPRNRSKVTPRPPSGGRTEPISD
ncbi:MAG: hypothetical protein H7837_06645 [Magnetococcus sp. MYC-9]